MRRRKFIAAVGTAAGGATTGCIGPFANGEEEEEENSPEATVRDFMDALNRGDREGVNALLHEDGELEPIPEEAGLEVQEREVEEVEVLEETDDTVTVEVTVTVRPRSPDESERTEVTEWELRRSNGDWRVWDRPDF